MIATRNGVRCVHGLKAGNCNTCPATRDDETSEWTFDAIGRGRTRTVGGREYRCNRHGVIARRREDGRGDGWDAFFYWSGPAHSGMELDSRGEREYRDAIYAAFDRVGVVANCRTNHPGYCACPARF